jgi:deoxycytidylate deaminase
MPSKITQNHIDVALHASAKSPMYKKFGAILMSPNGEIISVGYNRPINGITDDVKQCLLCG